MVGHLVHAFHHYFDMTVVHTRRAWTAFSRHRSPWTTDVSPSLLADASSQLAFPLKDSAVCGQLASGDLALVSNGVNVPPIAAAMVAISVASPSSQSTSDGHDVQQCLALGCIWLWLQLT